LIANCPIIGTDELREGTVTHIGFLPHSEPLNRNANGTKVDSLVAELDPGYKLLGEPETIYGMVRSTHKTINKQILLFDVPDVAPPPSLARAEALLGGMLDTLGVYSTVIERSEVIYKAKSSAGYLYTQYGDKGDIYNKHPWMLDDFWDNVPFNVDAMTLWKCFGKEEILPLSKILEENQRCIESPPVTEFNYGARLCQAFNKSLHDQHRRCPTKVGVTLQYGGFNALVLDMADCVMFFAGDIKKMDKYTRWWLLQTCKRLRIRQYRQKPGGMSREEYAARIAWVYRSATWTYIILPSGQVLFIRGGMKSGFVNTTDDNTMDHLLVLFGLACETYSGINSWTDIYRIFTPVVYSDDHFGGVRAPYEFLCDFHFRSQFYRSYGFILKEEDDVVGPTPAGIKFLGATFVNWMGLWAPQYDVDRLRATFLVLKKKIKVPGIRLVRWTAALLLATFTDHFEDWRELCVRLVSHLDKKHGMRWRLGDKWLKALPLGGEDEEIAVAMLVISKMGGLGFVPTHDECVAYWMGYEASVSSRNRALSAEKKVPHLLQVRRDYLSLCLLTLQATHAQEGQQSW